MPAAIQPPYVLVGHGRHQFAQFRVLTEEMLTRVSAALGLVILIFAVNGFFHSPAQQAIFILGEKLVPVRSPDYLDHSPACAAEHALEFLDDFAIAAHRTIQALEIAIDHKNQVIQFFAAGERNGAE